MQKKHSQTSLNNEGSTANIKQNEKEAYPPAKLGEIKEKTDAFKIINVSFERNFMLFEVSYSGGCQKHEFDLVGSPNISKSLPPLRVIQLQHRANGDNCKALITEKLKFSISNLAEHYNPGNKIRLQLKNTDQEYTYSYE